jgi:hypothetical protein
MIPDCRLDIMAGKHGSIKHSANLHVGGRLRPVRGRLSAVVVIE